MEKTFTEVKDSGSRESFDTGSVRDTELGKGCPSLIPWEYVGEFFYNATVWQLDINDYSLFDCIRERLEGFASIPRSDLKAISAALISLAEATMTLLAKEQNCDPNASNYAKKIPAFRRLAVHYQNGAVKYSKNNWRRGQPVSRYVNSLWRHFWCAAEKKQDEDHVAAMLWNIVAIYVMIKEVENKNLPESIYDYPFEQSDWK